MFKLIILLLLCIRLPHTTQSRNWNSRKVGVDANTVCEERTPVFGKGVVYPCGSSDCFFDSTMPDSGSREYPRCVSECSPSNFLNGISNVTTGMCILKACNERLQNDIAPFPCGSADCFLDPLGMAMPGMECFSVCPTDNSHTGAGGEDGVCVLRPCEKRTPNSTNFLPCGESTACVLDPSAQKCVGTCKANEHLTGEVMPLGECKLKECDDRGADLTRKFVCGTNDCFYDPTDDPNSVTECHSQCPVNGILNGVGNVTTGVCVLRSCDERLANTKAPRNPCGSGCFYNKEAMALPGYECVTVCPSDDNLHTGASKDGVCLLKPCNERIATTSDVYPYPCGSQDCVVDPTAVAVPNLQCVTACPKNTFLSGEINRNTGSCELLACRARKVNVTTLYPCGTRNCFAVHEPSDAECVDECGELGSYEGINGVCSFFDPWAASPGGGNTKSTSKLIVIIACSVGGFVVLAVAALVIAKYVKGRAQRKRQDEELCGDETRSEARTLYESSSGDTGTEEGTAAAEQ